MALPIPPGDIILDCASSEVKSSDESLQQPNNVDDNILTCSTNTGNESFRSNMCKVCDVNVPQNYMKEHLASTLHKNCEKIAQYFLERAQIPIVDDTSEFNNNVMIDWVYCEQCSKAVIAKNQVLHYSSNDHLKSLERVTLLNNFIKEYIGNVNIQYVIQIEEITSAIDDKSDCETNKRVKNNDLKRKRLSSDYKDITDCVSKDINVKKQKLNDKCFKDDVNIESENCFKESKQANDVKILTLRANTTLNANETFLCKTTKDYLTYLKEMNAEYSLKFKLPFVDFIVVESNDSERIKVTMDAFHSYKRFNDYIYCQLCNVLLPPETKKDHSATESHVKRVILPLNNNFTRQITTSWKHCLVCNEMVVSDSKHANDNPKHKMLIKQVITQTDDKEISDHETSIKDFEQSDKALELSAEIDCNNAIDSQNNQKESDTEIPLNNETDTNKNNIRLLYLLDSVSNEVENNVDLDNVLNSPLLPIDKLDDNTVINKINVPNVISNANDAKIDCDNIDNQQDVSLLVTNQFDRTVDDTTVLKRNLLPDSIVNTIDSNVIDDINDQNNSDSSLVGKTNNDKYQVKDVISETILQNNENIDNNIIDNNQLLDVLLRVNNTAIDNEDLQSTNSLVLSDNVNVVVNQPELHEINNLIENSTDVQNNQIDLHINPTAIFCDASEMQENAQNTFSNDLNEVENTVNIISEEFNTPNNVFERNMEIVDEDNNQLANEKHAYDTINANATNLETVVGITDFLLHLKEISMQFNLTSPNIENDFVIINTPNGNTINVDINAFNSFKKMNGAIICQVCQEWMSDIRAHTLNTTHMARIVMPVDDNFARQVNNAWSHCLLCNIMILNDLDHVSTSPNHNKVNIKLNEQLTVTVNSNIENDCEMNDPEELSHEKDVETKDAANLLTNTEIQENFNKIEDNMTSNTTYLKDIISKYNLNIDLKFLESVFENKGLNKKALFEYFHSYKCVNESMYCQVCQLWILNDIYIHTYNERHLKYITQTVDSKYIRQVKESSHHCLICNEIVAEPKSHTVHDDVFKNNDKPNKPVRAFCGICDIIIETTDFKAHMNSQEHINNIVKVVDNDSDIRCNLNKEKTDSNAKSDSKTDPDAISDSKTDSNAKSDSKIDSDAISDSKTDSNAKSDSKTDFDAISDSKTDSNAKSVSKTDSNSNIKINIENKIETLIASNNRSIADKVTSKHGPNIDNFNTNIYEYTSIYFNSYESIEIVEFRYYLNAVIKRFKLKKLPKFVLEVDSIGVILPSGSKYSVSVDQFHGFKYVRGYWYCQVCRTWINEGKLIHSLSKRHVDGVLMNFIDEMLIRKTLGLWYHCIMCNIPVRNIMHHITSVQNHIKHNYTTNYTKVNKSNNDDQVMIYCEVCDRYIHAIDFTPHTKGSKHIKNNAKRKELLEKDVICIDSSDDDNNVAAVNKRVNVANVKNVINTKTPVTGSKNKKSANRATVNSAANSKIATTISRTINTNLATNAKNATNTNFTTNPKTATNTNFTTNPKTATNTNFTTNPKTATNTNLAAIANKQLIYKPRNAVIKMVNDFRDYLDDITTKFNKKFHFVSIDNGKIIITTPSGIKAVITVNDFHSFRNPEISLFCQVCQVYVSTDKMTHMRTKPHVEHISKPLDDNFIRRINNAWSHCLVCNQMVFRGIDHVNLSNKHNDYNKI